MPLALLAETWLQGKAIVMLEPRRLVAKAAAMRMAELLPYAGQQQAIQPDAQGRCNIGSPDSAALHPAYHCFRRNSLSGGRKEREFLYQTLLY